MRIRQIETRLLQVPLEKEMGGSARRPPIRARWLAMVRLITDEGLVGYGESYGTPEVVRTIVNEVLAPFFIGTDPLRGDALAKAVDSGIGYHGPKGIMVEALSAIDIALWDLRGKALGQPVSALIGGRLRDSVPCYAASVYLGSVGEAVRQAAMFRNAGFDAIKVKVGMGIEHDVRVFSEVRREVGEEVTLMADANGVYDARQAIHLGRRLEALGLYWFEEPVRVEDYRGYARVGQALECYVAGSEGEYTRHGFRDLVVQGDVDVVQPDLTRCGGLTEGLAIALLASSFNRRLSPHCWSSVFGLAAALHLTAAVSNGLTVEYDAHPNPLREGLVPGQLKPREGHLDVPTGPGLGLDVNEVFLEAHTVWASIA